MDFHTFKRRDLQALCKLNNIPANTTNASMADALASLPTVEGLEELLGKVDSEAQGSPERSVLTSPNVPRTTNRRKAVNQELEGSKLATRTSCRTRTKAVEGTDAKKTPATRTTRKKASQEASVQKNVEKDLQAEFEADMKETEVHGNELQEISEEVSGVSVEVQSEAQNEINGGQEVNDVDDIEKNKDEDNVVNEMQDEEASEKVDFHSLNRKVLQNLCKKNKIPANMTNAAMADALDSLEIVEGLQEFVLGCKSQVPSSPLVSGITSCCARRSRTTMRSTKEEPRSSKMITKSCHGSRRRIIEEVEQGKTDVPETPTALVGSAVYEIEEKEDSVVQKSEPKKLEDNSSIEASEVSGVAEFNSDISNSLMQEEPVIKSTVEDDNEEDNNSLFNVENLKEPEEFVPEVDENVVEAEVIESSEVSEVLVSNCATQHEDVKTSTAGCELEIIEVQHTSNLVIAANSESEDVQLENLDIITAEDHITKEYVSGFTTQADQSVTVTSDSAAHMSAVEVEVEVEGGDAEGDVSEKSDTESATQADKVSLENNVRSESEGSYTEDDMSENSDCEATAQNCLVSNCATQHEDVKTNTAGCDLETIEVQHTSNLVIAANSESEDVQLENLDIITAEDHITKEYVSGFTTQADQSVTVTSDSAAHMSVVDVEVEVEGGNAEGDVSEKSDTESATQADKVSLENNVGSESEGSYTEDDMSENSDCEATAQDDQPSWENNVESETEDSCTEDETSDMSDSEATAQDYQPSLENNVESDSEDSYTEEEMSEKSYSEATAQVYQPSLENNMESDSEDSYTEEEMSEKSYSEATAQDYQPSLENNVESDSEDSYTEEEMSEKSDPEATVEDDQPSLEINVEKLENPDMTTDSTADTCWVEKPEDGHAEDMISNMFDTESTIQATTCPPPGNDYNQTSLRKLKQMLKERLQAKTLAKKMDNLTLQENVTVEEVQECFVESENAISMELSGKIEEARIQVAQTVPQDTVNEDDVGESEEDANDETATLHPVDVLLDNEVIPVDAVIGSINVSTCPTQATPSKGSSMTKKPPQLLTPSKSSSKTPISAGRKSVFDDNKENIDNGVTKTEPGKIKIAVNESLNILSPLSMAKLKRDFKLQSEKKKQALQQRSENHRPLAGQ